MNETQLASLRRDPSPEFAARLRDALAAQDVSSTGAPPRGWPVARIAASMALVGVVTALLTVPAVRASAAAFLARFRVVNFVAVDVEPERAKALESGELDLERLVGGQVQVLQDPGQGVKVFSPDQASKGAGFRVRQPEWLPPEVTLREVEYTNPGRMQVLADTGKIRNVLDFLGIDDVDVPQALHGQLLTVEVPPIVRLFYANDRGARTTLLQARSPEISLPEGVALPQLAEIGLRVLGFAAADARRFATAIDWRSTLLVPIPSGEVRFKHVTINGNPGLSFERLAAVAAGSDPPPGGTSGEAPRAEQMAIWSADGMVFGIRGNFRPESVLQMAYSVR